MFFEMQVSVPVFIMCRKLVTKSAQNKVKIKPKAHKKRC